MLNYYELSCDGRLKQRSLSHKFLTMPNKITLNSQEDWKTTTVYLITFILSSAYLMISRLRIPASPISFFEKWFFKGFVKQSKLSPTAFCRDEIWLFQRMQECCFQSLILENWIIRSKSKRDPKVAFIRLSIVHAVKWCQSCRWAFMRDARQKYFHTVSK